MATMQRLSTRATGQSGGPWLRLPRRQTVLPMVMIGAFTALLLLLPLTALSVAKYRARQTTAVQAAAVQAASPAEAVEQTAPIVPSLQAAPVAPATQADLSPRNSEAAPPEVVSPQAPTSDGPPAAQSASVEAPAPAPAPLASDQAAVSASQGLLSAPDPAAVTEQSASGGPQPQVTQPTPAPTPRTGTTTQQTSSQPSSAPSTGHEDHGKGQGPKKGKRD